MVETLGFNPETTVLIIKSQAKQAETEKYETGAGGILVTKQGEYEMPTTSSSMVGLSRPGNIPLSTWVNLSTKDKAVLTMLATGRELNAPMLAYSQTMAPALLNAARSATSTVPAIEDMGKGAVYLQSRVDRQNAAPAEKNKLMVPILLGAAALLLPTILG